MCRVHHAELWEETQAGIKIVERKINNLRYAGDTTLMVETEEELKSLLIKVKEENEKAGLKFNIQKTKTMSSGPITSRQTEGEKVEVFFWAADHGHEIKRHLLLGTKAMANLNSILKSRDITLLTKVCIVKTMVSYQS